MSSETTAEGIRYSLKASDKHSSQTGAVFCQASLAPHEILSRLSSFEILALLGILANCQGRLVHYCYVCMWVGGGCLYASQKRRCGIWIWAIPKIALTLHTDTQSASLLEQGRISQLVAECILIGV